MRRINATLSALFCFLFITATQAQTLVVQGVPPDLYIVHNPVAKENYYSVARLYNVPPKEIASYNNLSFENGLQLGQPIKIPLTRSNFTQSPEEVNKGFAIPLYHVVEAKEGLYRVRLNYKLPMDLLKKWNHLSSDEVSNGAKLIVGYLKVQSESPLAKTGATRKEDITTAPKKNETILSAKKDEVSEAPKKQVVETPSKEDIGTPGDRQAISKKEDGIQNNPPAEVKNNGMQKNPAAPVINPAATQETATGINVPVAHTAINFNGGAFKNLYQQQQEGKTPVTESGASGVFKSTSGWRDGKYYCFNNNAPAGTIAKITNTANGKSIYAKVLDLIPDINQNTGLILHLSNAAAEELGVTTNRFDCTVSYSK